jgi:HD superfamily phosphodiesterase
MTDPYAPIWKAALPYLRSRKNDVHVPISFDYAERLLKHHPNADPEIVLLAIVLHDIGWAVVDHEAIYTEGFGPQMNESDIRIAHEREGARLARGILEEFGYPSGIVAAVVAIIDGHDTRRDSISAEDELVKDADKLWRFTPTGIAIACDWWGQTPAEYARDLLTRVVDQLFTDAAVEMARADIAESRRLLKLDLLVDTPG